MHHITRFFFVLPFFLGCDCAVESPRAVHVAPPAVGSITGTVRLLVPFKPDIVDRIPAGAVCGGKPLDPAKLKSISLGDGIKMANVYVAVMSGLNSGRYRAPVQSVLLDQSDCVYVPRVLGLMTDQPPIVRNSDKEMHNVHFQSKENPSFNFGQPMKGDERTLSFSKGEIGLSVRCDVHPWMQGWIHVSDHPFFAVTGVDGKYSIKGLPPGEYEIMAWHERFQNAPLVEKVKVAADQTSTLDFTFEGKRK